jgi:hypothetical protein
MQIGDCLDQFRSVYLGPLLVELLLLPKISEKLAAIQKINNKVKLCFCLESEMQGYNIGAFNSLQNVSLSLGFYQEVLFDELILTEDFHCIWHSSVLFTNQVDLAEGSSANHLDVIEIIY